MPSSKTPREARTEIYADFLAHWLASSASAVPIAWDNVDFKQSGVEYIRVQLQHVSGTIAALGNEKYRREMLMTINIWTPEGGGQKRSDELGEVVLAFIETFSLTVFRVRDPGFNEIGVFDGFYQSSVVATIEYDALRT